MLQVSQIAFPLGKIIFDFDLILQCSLVVAGAWCFLFLLSFL